MADLDQCGSTETVLDSEVLEAENNMMNHDSKLQFSEDEETLVVIMFNLVGERWSLIAGRIPGRTAEEIEKYWNSRYYSKSE